MLAVANVTVHAGAHGTRLQPADCHTVASDMVIVHRWERNLSGSKGAIVTAAPAPAPSVSPFGPPGADGGVVMNADGGVVMNPIANGGRLPVAASPFQPAGWGGDPGGEVGGGSS